MSTEETRSAAQPHPPVVPDPEQGCDACGEPMTNYDADGQWCDKHGKPSAALGHDDASKRAVLSFNFLVERLVIAMQAAWIEWQHGNGSEAAMEWIWNTLEGPDQLPDVAETGTDAQAFFDREIDASRRREREALAKLDGAGKLMPEQRIIRRERP